MKYLKASTPHELHAEEGPTPAEFWTDATAWSAANVR